MYGLPGDEEYMAHCYALVKKELKHQRRRRLKRLFFNSLRCLLIGGVVIAVGLVW